MPKAAARYAAYVLLAGAPLAVSADEPLPALGALNGQTSVVGVSSGGYMATQLAVAWPERFAGVGVVAAGPWGCSQGSLSMALNRCMKTRDGLPNLEALEERRVRYQAGGLVGDQAPLGRLRAFIWHGGADDVVEPGLVELLAGQWRQWLAASDQLKFVRHQAAGHGWPVRLHAEETVGPHELGNCRQGGGSHVLACDEDVARDMLDWLYPERDLQTAEPGELVAFDQSAFAAKGLADTGYLYVPASCQEEACPVTIALHGCQMSTNAIDDTFVSHSGLNHWAARHRQLVLYPQVDSSLSNPQGCWDWWGYAESLWQQNPLHDTREGAQISALMAMLDRLEESAVDAD